MIKKDIAFGLIAALFLGVFISRFASLHPDGLERVAKDKGFINKAHGRPLLRPLAPDYIWPWIKDEKIAASVSGGAGALIAFAISYCAAALIRKNKGRSKT